MPDYGIGETARRTPTPWTSPAEGFYYIEPSRHGASDENNPFGTPAHPRQTIPELLPAGAIVELHGAYDRQHSSPHGIVSRGTAARPVFIRGVDAKARPMIRSPWELSATYTILENLDFGPADSKRTGELAIIAPTSHLALRDSEVHGNANGGGLGIVSWKATESVDHVVILGNRVHDNGDVRADFDQDCHGIAVGSRVSQLWVVDNELYRNSGDGIQINGGREAQASTHHIYVARNVAHDNKQTGFWTKQAVDVIFAQNLCYGHRLGNSSYGQCMGLQYAPERVWFISNHIHDCDFGIAFSSDSDMGNGKSMFIVGNVIHNIHHSAGYNPNTAWSNAGIMLAGGTVHVIFNNTIYDVDAGINSPITATNYIVNNIVANITEPQGRGLFLEQPAAAKSIAVHDNVFGPGARIRVGDRAVEFGAAALPGNRFSRSVDSLFVGPRADDFRLADRSADAVKGSTEPATIAAAYRSLYNVDLPVDFGAVGAFDAFALHPPATASASTTRSQPR